MNINNNTTPLAAAQTDVTQSGDAARDQAVHNAMNTFQARYGEKPKAERAVKKQLDKDDFMRIMLTEMKHQDPTKPMDSDKMATQMAQLTSVEQLKNVSASIDKLVDKNNASDRLAMSSMIGKTVTVDKGKFSHTKGIISPVNFTLPEDAAKIKISIQDEHGEEIFSRELEPQKAGSNVYNWDGLTQNGTYAKSSPYSVRVDAENSKGAKIKLDPIAHEAIVGVSFDAGETNFLIGNPKQPQKIPMRNVVKIEGENMIRAGEEAKLAASAKALQGSNDGDEKKTAGFELPPELAEKVKAQTAAREAQAAQAEEAAKEKLASANVAAAKEESVKPEGFANGLRGE